MKTLLSIVMLIMLSISMISCETLVERDAGIIERYFNSSILFECKIVSLHEPTYQDSSRFKTDVYYVFAKDIWDAQRLFENNLSDLQSTLNGSEVYWNPIPISNRAPYPYYN